MDLFCNYTVDDVKSDKGGLIILKPEDSFAQSLKVLVTKGIHSAPVVSHSHDEIKFIGVIDMIELVCFTIKIYNDGKYTDIEDFCKLLQKEFKNNTVQHVLEFSERVSWPVPEGSSFSDLLIVLSKHAHQVYIIGNDGDVTNVVSQSAVLKVFWKNITNLYISNKTLLELGFSEKELVTVSTHDIVIDAFKKIAQEKISAVAVINKEGELVGNISATDIRSIGVNGTFCDRLFKQVTQFLVSTRLEFHAPKEVVTVKIDDTLSKTIEIVVEKKLHRVWVVDNNNKPIGLLSLRDILLLILNSITI